MKHTKKLLLLLGLTILVLSLASCTVNWFGGTRDVPWYYVAVPVILIGVIGYYILMSRTYICPDCHTEFKVKPYQLSVMVHMNGKRLAKCPNCGRKGFCQSKRR